MPQQNQLGSNRLFIHHCVKTRFFRVLIFAVRTFLSPSFLQTVLCKMGRLVDIIGYVIAHSRLIDIICRLGRGLTRKTVRKTIGRLWPAHKVFLRALSQLSV